METGSGFEARRQALENEFFRRVDERLAAELRAKISEEEQRDTLANVCGVKDPQVIEALVKAKINAETLAALTMIPLVRVAWADRQMDAKEKAAILKAADESRCPAGSPGHVLLDSWLTSPPSAALFQTWKDFVHELKKTAKKEHYETLHAGVVKNARDVARAAGGLLGFHTVSEKEEAVLAEIEEAFQQA